MSATTLEGRDRFPRSARLLRPGQFKDVFTHGRRIGGPVFRLHVWLRGGTNAPCWARLGIAVPKKVAALAVERNRVRRIVRESFRCRRAQLPPGDYALVALPPARGATGARLREALDALWSRAGALKPDPADPTMPGPTSRFGAQQRTESVPAPALQSRTDDRSAAGCDPAPRDPQDASDR